MPVKILVVNDSALECSIIKNALGEYNVLIADNGTEAMRLIELNPDIELILVDFDLCSIGGYQLLASLKADSRFKDIHTIILTDPVDIEDEIKGLELGATDCFRKPIQEESLKARIDMHLKVMKQKSYEEKLQEQQVLFEALFQQAPIGIAFLYGNETSEANNGFVYRINPVFEFITGRTQAEIIKLGWESITHPDDLEEDLRNFRKLKSGEISGYSMEKRYVKPDGSIVWVHMTTAPLILSNNSSNNHICLVQDITKRKEIEAALQESERSKSVLLSNLPGLAYRCYYDNEWTMQFVSAGCYKLTGYHPESLLYNKDLSFNDLIAPEFHEPLRKEWKRILEKKLPLKYEYEIITASGDRKWVLEMGEGIYDEQGKVEALEGIIIDITDRKKMEDNLKYNNEHDRWTGLYNRNYLENLLSIDLKKMAREKRAVVSINLSAVRLLTTSYGFHYTQELMKKIADALRVHCTDKKLLFNTFENRFSFYVKGYKDKKELTEFCADIVRTLEPILSIERIGGGIGVIELDKDNEQNIDQLLKKVLIASERAIDIYDKDFGICFFDTEMEAKINREEAIKHELGKIAEGDDSNGLFLQFQPILELKSNKICGFEALARLHTCELGLVPPLEFIPIAEKTKLIIGVGEKIFLKALCFINKLKKNGYEDIYVSINISPIQLLRSGFSENLFEMINEMQVNTENIGLEITESVFANDYQEINRIIGRLKNFGLSIAIDDFGTGYSSLSRERELNVNCLKIDKYFVDNLLTIDAQNAITGDIISMAHKLGHCTVAEGVEHEKQMEYLKNNGCDKIQGYFISRPLDEDAAIQFLKKFS